MKRKYQELNYFEFGKVFRIIQKLTLLSHRTTFGCEPNRVCEYICIHVLWYYFAKLDYMAVIAVLLTKLLYIL